MNADVLVTPLKNIASIIAKATRPPTPPRETEEYIEDAARFLRGEDDIAPIQTTVTASKILVDTPPSSSPLRSLPSISSIPKRVDFLPDPTYYQSSAFPDDAVQRPIRRRQVGKSILKSFNPQLATPDEQDKNGYFTCSDASQFPIMFAQALQGLKSTSSRTAHLDAYLSINGAFALYNDLPEIDLIRRNMSTMQEILQRDIIFNQPASREDVNIIIQVIKLTARIVAHEALVKSASLEFQATVLEQCTAALGQADFPKQGTKFYIGLLAQQRLSHSVWSSFRVEKLLTTLQTIDQRFNSKSLVTTRLEVYKRLIDASPDMMLKSMKSWLAHSMHGMLSDDKNTRLSALSLFDGTARVFGSNRTAIATLHRLFDIKTENGTYSEHFLKSLTRFTKDESTKTYVPQIFAAIVLFHRHREYPLQRWQRWKAWLLIISECFKSSDIEVLQCSHFAWRRLVYVLRPSNTTSDEMWNLIQMPISFGLRKMGSESKQHRRIALDSFYNLLHYALRPESSFEALDSAWEKAVGPTLLRMINGNHKGRNTACSILNGLLTANAGSWNVDAALQVEQFSSSDLPKLDNRWSRSRIRLLTRLFDSLFEEAVLADDNSFDTARSVWVAMLKSVADAGTQEVKISTDLKFAVGHILAVLHKRWSAFVSPGYKHHSSSIYDRFDTLLVATFEHLALHKLTDPIIDLSADGTLILLRSATENELDKARTSVTPLIFALLLRSAEPKHINSSATNRNLVSALLSLSIDGMVTSSSKILHLSQTFESLQNLLRADSCWDELSMLWAQVATKITAVLEESDSQQWSLVRERDVTNSRKLLGAGLSIPATRYDISMSIVKLAIAIINAEQHGRETSRSQACALTDSIAGDLYKMRREASDERLSSFASAVVLLLKSYKWPASSQSLVEVLRSDTTSKSAGQISSNILRLASHTSAAVYAATSQGELMVDPLEMLQEITKVASECADSQLPDILAQYHASVTIWVEDKEQIVQNPELEHFATGLPKIWSQWLQMLSKSLNLFWSNTSVMKEILNIGVDCDMTIIADMTKTFCKAIIGRAESASATEMSANISKGEASMANTPETDIERSLIEQTADSRRNDNGQITTNGKQPPQIQAKSATSSMTDGKSVSAKHPSTSASTAPPRPRHDDSQVQFVAINAKQPADDAESQHLTDRQHQVRARQVDLVRMYPDASSSPMAVASSSPTKERAATFSDAIDAIENFDTYYDAVQDVPLSGPSRIARPDSHRAEASSPMQRKVNERTTTESEAITADFGEHIDEHNASLAAATKRPHSAVEIDGADDLPLPGSDSAPATKRQRRSQRLSSQNALTALSQTPKDHEAYITKNDDTERDSTPDSRHSSQSFNERKRKHEPEAVDGRIRKDQDPVVRDADIAVASGEMDEEIVLVGPSRLRHKARVRSSGLKQAAPTTNTDRAEMHSPSPAKIIGKAATSKKNVKRASFPNLPNMRGINTTMSQPTADVSKSSSQPPKKPAFENLKHELERRLLQGQTASNIVDRGDTAEQTIELDGPEQNGPRSVHEEVTGQDDEDTIIPRSDEQNKQEVQPASTEDDQVVAQSVENEDVHVIADSDDEHDEADVQLQREADLQDVDMNRLPEPRSSFVQDSMEDVVEDKVQAEPQEDDWPGDTGFEDVLENEVQEEPQNEDGTVLAASTSAVATTQTDDLRPERTVSAMLRLLQEALEISKDIRLDANDERSADDMLFVLRTAIYDAGRRGRDS